MGTDEAQVKSAAPTTPIRFLGVWLRACKNNSHNTALAKSIINQITSALQPKSMTAAHVVYINNRVLLPKLLYILMVTSLSASACSNLQRPMLALLKTKCHLPWNTDMSIIGV